MLQKNLEQFGLNEKEVLVYLALLELGEAGIGQISRKSGIKRTTLYDVIALLKEKGLASTVEREKKTLYLAEDPRSLEGKLEEKKFLLKKMLPELLSLANTLDHKPKIRFYEGIEGIKELYRDTLNYPDQELLAWISEEAVEAFDEKFLSDYYLPRRTDKKIWVRAIAPDLPYMRKYQDQDIPSLRKTKLVDAEKFPFHVEINLYGKNKIGIMSFSEKISLIIESEKIFSTLKSIFELQWLMLPNRSSIPNPTP